MLPRLHVGMTVLLAGLFAGCCNCPGDRMAKGPLPEPISLDEQVVLLDARTRAMPRLRATTVGNGIELRFPDEEGHEKTENVDGIPAIAPNPQARRRPQALMCESSAA